MGFVCSHRPNRPVSRTPPTPRGIVSAHGLTHWSTGDLLSQRVSSGEKCSGGLSLGSCASSRSRLAKPRPGSRGRPRISRARGESWSRISWGIPRAPGLPQPRSHCGWPSGAPGIIFRVAALRFDAPRYATAISGSSRVRSATVLRLGPVGRLGGARRSCGGPTVRPTVRSASSQRNTGPRFQVRVSADSERLGPGRFAHSHRAARIAHRGANVPQPPLITSVT